ncbi:MAG TPA: chromate transporter [Burkholderiales bacterium]|nr:chromate transporter [Burkholderiales bacterium]
MPLTELAALFAYFLMLSFIAVGGAPSILPEIHRYVVEVNGWITSSDFARLYTLAQVAPGPNVMYLPLLGWDIAGWPGALALTFAFIAPSLTLTMWVARLYARHPTGTAVLAVRRGLTPITIGLTCASGWVLMHGAAEDWRGYALTAFTVVFVTRTSFNPLWILVAGAGAGLFGLV